MAEMSAIPEGLISETKFFEADTPITKVVPAVMQYKAVVINDEKGYYGIIDSREVYKSFQGLSTQKNETAGKYAIRVPRITDATSIDDVVYYFAKTRTKALPYMKGGKTAGVLRRTTLLKVLLSLGKLADISVSEVMVAPLIGLDVDATISQARAAMKSNKINRIAIMQGDKLSGIVSNYDIVDRYFKPQERLPQRKSYSYNPSNIKLESVVEKNVRTIEESAGLSDAVREMVENNVSALVVTKSDKPVGIITELDVIISAMARDQASTNRIFISGLTSETYEYEDEIREALESFLRKIERIKNLRVDYITLVVRKFKAKSYELHARLALAGKGGIMNMHVEGHMFERTLTELLDKLEHEVRRNKERYLAVRRIYGSHPEEEIE